MEDKNLEYGYSPMRESVRLGFIWKVFTILALSLLLTTGIVAIPLASDPVAEFLYANVWILITAVILMFIVEIAIFCCSAPARQVPINYICLAIFVICESILLAYVCSNVSQQQGNANVVFMAAGMTAGIVRVLTIYALTTKTDFTTCMGALWALFGVFIIFGIFALIFHRDPIINTIYCALGVAIFGIYLVIDVQLISQSKRYQLTEDDYIIGVLILYIDIIQIFLYILRLLSRK